MAAVLTVAPAGGAVGWASQPSSPEALQIGVGVYQTCALLSGGQIRCWGAGVEGELGYPHTVSVGATDTPASAGPVDLGPGRTATAISVGGYDTCSILDNGNVLCWGYGRNGRLGYGNTNNVGDTQTPDTAGPVNLGAGRTAKAISAGLAHTCAILDDGSVRCWGLGSSGQLGYASTSTVGDIHTPDTAGPVDLGAGRTAKAISAGGLHTCAILDDGSVRCWGLGTSGQLGYGNTSNVGDTQTPGSVAPVDLGPGRTAVAISAGDAHTCAILDNGSVLCWGYGGDGRLGYGNTSNVGDTQTPGSVGPVDLGPGRTAVAISAGGHHTCAILDDGNVRCWGLGAYGQIGYCSTSNVGDRSSSIPATSGPVNLVVGDGGEPCPPVNSLPPEISGHAVGGQKLDEGHGSWSPAPTGYAYQWERCNRTGASCGSITGATGQSYTLGTIDVGSTIRVAETASDGGASTTLATSGPTAVVKAAVVVNPDVARGRGFRACLATVSAGAKHARALTHQGSKRARARARRRLARQLAAGRTHCVQRWGRTPGPVTGLRVLVRGNNKLELGFAAPGTDGNHSPAARSYLVKQALRPIRNARDFARAQTLCHGACGFAVTQVGEKIALTVTNLRPHTTYYYAVAARDNVSSRLGPRSQVTARTL